MLTPGISTWSSRALFAGILFFGLLAMTARNATDPDLWWHLRTGQWIVETRQVPHTDPFSFTREGKPWVSHEWLSEVVFYQLWRFGGATALIVFSSLITATGFLVLYWRGPGKPHWAAAATVLGAIASAPSWGARPQMFTFTLASVLLWLVECVDDRPRLLLWIPPLFLIWLNLHAGFALGPVLLLLCAAGLALEAAVGTTPWAEACPTILRMLAITLACLALVPLNPSGVQLYRYPFDTLRSSGMRSLIAEWFSPDFHQALYAPVLLLLLLLLVALARSGGQIKGRVLLPLVFTSLAALDAVRHIPIFILLAIPVVAAAVPDASRLRGLPPPHRVSSRLQRLFGPAVLILLAAFAVLRFEALARIQANREAEQFPRDAVAFLQSRNEPRRLFVYYDWAGYAIWKLYPQYRVFVDGRADLFGDSLLQQCIQTVPQVQDGWRTVLDDWEVGAVLLPQNTALAQALALDPHWSFPYRDSLAVMFTKTPETPPADPRPWRNGHPRASTVNPSKVPQS